MHVFALSAILGTRLFGQAPKLVEVVLNNMGPASGAAVGVICPEAEFRSIDCRRSALAGAPLDGRAELGFHLPPGSRAVSLFHRLNGNRLICRPFLGFPRKRAGFSRNPRLFGKILFADGAIGVPRGGMTINLQFEPKG